MSRKRRRTLRVGGWLASLALATALGIQLAPAGPYNPLLVVIFPLGVALVWHAWMKDEGGVAVFTYHSVSADAAWLPWGREISVTPESFERHVRALQRAGCTIIRTADLLRARQTGGTLPSRPVVIHLDDGYLDNWVAALPILQRCEAPATLFVSLDFVESGETPRPTLDDVADGQCRREDVHWQGYCNWAELRRMEQSGLIDVQAHGTDHGRVITGPRVVDQVRPQNWRRLAWVQWAEMNGNKASWYRYDEPPCVPYGTPVRQSQPALAAPAWSDAGAETPAEYESRVQTVLARSRTVLERELHKQVDVFCWPQNRASARARELAAEAGYDATTGGEGENRDGEDPRVISRQHAGDRPLGVRLPWLEGPAIVAQARCFHGNYYWYPLVLAMNLCRKAVGALGGLR